MARRRRQKSKLGRRLLVALAALPLAYLLAALLGALIPVNRGWAEPDEGVTIYLADNGIHIDLVLPVAAAGTDWSPFLPRGDVARPDPAALWIAFGAGERRVYLDTPRWRDIRPGTIWAALSGGERVMHVEWVRDPAYSARAIRLRPEEYRRLWQAVRAGFERDSQGRPRLIGHPGYGPDDAFYLGTGKADAIQTCNQWAAGNLRLAGVEAPLWSPFTWGLTWRYRPAPVMPAKAGISGRTTAAYADRTSLPSRGPSFRWGGAHST